MTSGVDLVIHCAGVAHHAPPAKRADYRVNVDGVRNVAELAAASGVRHFILASSVAVYGNHGSEPAREESPCQFDSPYAESKFQGELAAREVSARAGMALTILRFGTLYGEGDPGNVQRLVQLIDRGKFFWVGRGSNRKTLLHRDDAARAAVRTLAQVPTQTALYNVAGRADSMRAIVETIAKALGKSVLSLQLPALPFVMSAEVLNALPSNAFRRIHHALNVWLSDDVIDSSRFRDRFSFHEEVSLSEGIDRQVEWYRKSPQRGASVSTRRT